MAEHQLPKLTVRVRFPSSAPQTYRSSEALFPERSGSMAINCGSVGRLHGPTTFGRGCATGPFWPTACKSLGLPVSALLSLICSPTAQLPSSAVELRRVSDGQGAYGIGPGQGLTRPHRDHVATLARSVPHRMSASQVSV